MDGQNEYDLLIKRFNAQDTDAYIAAYKLLFTELHLYAASLYAHTTVSPEDAVQDIFCSLWEKTDFHFDSLSKLKAFLYTAIKNKYKTYLEHVKVQEKYSEYVHLKEDFFTEVFENELYASLQRYIALLPESYSRVMKLYLSGYETEEIAEKLGLSPQTVYNTKHLAIRFLKEKLSKIRF